VLTLLMQITWLSLDLISLAASSSSLGVQSISRHGL